MCRRYVKNRSLSQIVQRQEDSSSCKATLRQREDIVKCAILGAQYSKAWIGKGSGNSIKNARMFLRLVQPTDEMERAI